MLWVLVSPKGRPVCSGVICICWGQQLCDSDLSPSSCWLLSCPMLPFLLKWHPSRRLAFVSNVKRVSMASPFLSQALLSVTIIMSCNLTWWLFCFHTPLVCVPSCCTRTLCCGEVELHMLFRKPGSHTGLSLVCIPTTTENIIVLVFRSFQNHFEVGKWTLWNVSPSFECFQSGYSLVASEAGWQQATRWNFVVFSLTVLQTKNFSV